jgi:hypothetical protein
MSPPRHLDETRLNPARAGDQSEQRRLADAVGADKAGHAADRDFEIDGVESERIAVAVGHLG